MKSQKLVDRWMEWEGEKGRGREVNIKLAVYIRNRMWIILSAMLGWPTY